MTEDTPRRPSSAQVQVAAAIAVLAATAVTYHLFHGSSLKQTALFYIGLPALLAIGLVLTKPAASITGTILKALTIGLLLSPIVLGEALVCVLVAAPLFYVVGLVIGLVADAARRRGPDGFRRSAVMLVPLGALMLEGTSPALTVPGDAVVSAERTVAASPEQVRAALAAMPCLTPRPWTLVKFPDLDSAIGGGLAPGDERRMAFTGPHGSGTLVLRVAESGPTSVRFAVASDTSPMANWWQLRESSVSWRGEGGRTAVRWTLRYRRKLAPAAYFGPVERIAAHEAAAYLIDAVATPHPCAPTR
jgi:hypothetical protein